MGLVGAGTSIDCGYPGWDAFLSVLENALLKRKDPLNEEKLQEHKKHVSTLHKMDIRTRLDAIAQDLGADYPKIFRETFSPQGDGLYTPEWIRLLFDLNLRILLTTNFTIELEAAARFHPSVPLGEAPDPVMWYQPARLDGALRRLDGRLQLVYLHGRWDEPLRQHTNQGQRWSPVILGEESYQFAYKSPGAVHKALEAILRTHTLLIVGASLADEDVKGVLRAVHAQTGPDAAPHYAILPSRADEDIEGNIVELRQRFGLVPIFYQLRRTLEGREDHSALEALLQDLVARMSHTTPRPLWEGVVSVAPGEYPPHARIVHALMRAADFEPRPQLQRPIEKFLAGEEGGILALVGLGGAGKTALVREALEEILAVGPHFPGGIFVWSFYDQPETADFFRNLASYVGRREIPEDWNEAQAYEAFRRACQSEERSLLILDGLEKLQLERPVDRRVHGGLTSPALRQLLLGLAQVPGALRAVVTTRFPLTDLESEIANPRVTTLDLDALTRPQARALLRRRGVGYGTDRDLDMILDHYGAHALTVDHLGRVIATYLDGDARRFRELGKTLLTRFEAGQTGTKLARVVAAYLGYLSRQEPAVRSTLERVAVFPRPVGIGLLTETFLSSTQSGHAANLSGVGEMEFRQWLRRLVELGFIHEEPLEGEEAYTLHPALRDAVLAGLGSELEGLVQTVRKTLESKLNLVAGRPGFLPAHSQVLDLVEDLISFHLDARNLDRAFELYWDRLGNHAHLGWDLEEYARGERIVRRLVEVTAGRAAFLQGKKGRLVTELALFLGDLGRLEEAIRWLKDNVQSKRWRDEPEELIVALQNLAHAQLLAGLLPAAEASARESLALSEEVYEGHNRLNACALLTAILEAMGQPSAALAAFAMSRHGSGPDDVYSSLSDLAIQQLLLRLGRLKEVRLLGLGRHGGYSEVRNRSYLARAEKARWLRRRFEAVQLLGWVHTWVFQSGHAELLLGSRLLQARLLWELGDRAAARAEGEEGLRAATTFSFNLYVIDFLVFLGNAALEDNDPDRAHILGSKALAKAEDLSCKYFWGQLDAHGLLARCAEAKQVSRLAFIHRQAAEALRGRVNVPDDLIQSLLPEEPPAFPPG